MQKLIGTALSTKTLTFQPGSGKAQLEVSVVNYSDRFASFQLEILAAGGDPSSERTWYTLSPEISTKKPPGDTTRFIVEIQRTPIVGFIGLMNLTVRVFSVELGTEERHIVRLRVEKGIGDLQIIAELPSARQQGYPNGTLEIPLRLYNPSPQGIVANLGLQSAYRWLSVVPMRIKLPPQQWIDQILSCAVPDIDEAIANTDYRFKLQITHTDSPPTQLAGSVEILPQGQIRLEVPQVGQSFPLKHQWLPQNPAVTATYTLVLINQSNSQYQAAIEVQQMSVSARFGFEIFPAELVLAPAQTETFNLKVSGKRSWWGWVREVRWQVAAQLTPPKRLTEPSLAPLPVVDREQTLTLKVFPVIPRWLQALLGLLGGVMVWWLLWGQYYYIRHQGAVNTVQFNGLGDRLLSGGMDQRVRHWAIQGKHLHFLAISGRADKAVRTLKYRPVDNNEMAMGLENGEIHIWNLLSGATTPRRILVYQKDDRVMDVEFTPDSRYLFSGYGSGLVAKWYVGPDFAAQENPDEPQLTERFDFAIADLALLGEKSEILAIGGRYNQLMLWNTVTQDSPLALATEDTPHSSSPTSQDYYITSLATPEQYPFRLAVADNQGRIRIWNLRPCLAASGPSQSCELLDQWEEGHGSGAIRAIAFSRDGSYLASVGDDGRLVVWPLRDTGARLTKYLQGQAIAQSTQPLNTVDIAFIPTTDENQNPLIQMVTGGDNGEIKLYRLQN